MLLQTLVAMWAFTFTVNAFWRMECRGRVGLARVDPLMSPGHASQHVHAIHGSNGKSPRAIQAVSIAALLHILVIATTLETQGAC
jgi:hypothetical protein